jgi:outer membrane protein OmpA-like peptidoglycan-associated protein
MKTNLTFLLFLYFHLNAFAQINKDEKIIDSTSVYFDFNKAAVKSESELLDYLKKNRSNVHRVLILAYTDSVGSIAYNKLLASQRLKSVYTLIQKTTWSKFKIDTVNANEIRGKRVKDDPKNRRVDVFFVSKQPATELTYNENGTFEFALETPIDLHINFIYGTDEFVQHAYENLMKLLQILKKDTSLLVDLRGHVCCGPDLPLSKSRAQAVKVYLVKNGIHRNRITAQGFSNLQPLVPETSKTAQAMNRRVEAVFTRKKM